MPKKTTLGSRFLLLLILCALAVSATGTTLYVQASGEFTSGVTADDMAVPGDTWLLSFDVDSNPVAGNPDSLGFDAPFSNFTYTVGGSPVSVTPGEIRFFTSDNGGLFTIYFGPETGFDNGQPIPEFSFSGDVVFTGTTTNPTINPNSYTVTDVIYSDASNYDDEGATATVTITAATETTPEPSTLLLCLPLVPLILVSQHRRIGKQFRVLFLTISLALGVCPLATYAQALPYTSTGLAPFTNGVTFYWINQTTVGLGYSCASTSEYAAAQCYADNNSGIYEINAGVLNTVLAGHAAYASYPGGYDCNANLGPTTGPTAYTVLQYSASDGSFYQAQGCLIPGKSIWTGGAVCPSGYIGSNSACSSSVIVFGQQLGPKTTCSCNAKAGSVSGVGAGSVGEPIDVASGNMSYQYSDYSTAGQNPLTFTRYYNSRGNQLDLSTFATSLGVNWRSGFDRYIQIGSPSSVIVERPGGQQLIFTLNGSTWNTDSDEDVTLTQSGGSWTFTDHDDTVESYVTTTAGNEALITSIEARSGYTQSLTYNSSNQLTSVTDSYGRSLTLTYNTTGTLNAVTTPESTTITYGYASVMGGNQLTSVTFSTSPAHAITYVYANLTLPFALTSAIDEDGNTYDSWTYDLDSRALTSAQGIGANLTTLVYGGGTTAVTNPLGVTETYTFTTQGLPKVAGISRAATATTAGATRTFTYDSSGYVASATNWNGNVTTYTNNSHGLPTTINEAVGSSVARTTSIAYDFTFVHLPDIITTPGLTTSFTYDPGGNILTRTLTDTTTGTVPYSTTGQTRTTTYTWSNFLLASAKTPNGNATTFTYDSSGALVQTTNALGQATSITSHTGGGLPLMVVDPNGVTTTLTYDARQRLLSSSIATAQGVRTTTFTYDAAGNLTKTTLPDGSALANTYDTAHRLTTITDLFHQTVAYTLDALGDRTKTNLTAVGNRIQRQHADSFDALGRTLTDTGGMGQVTTYSYDPNGNALSITDPLTRVTSRAFDALNRLTTITDPASGITTTTYDAHDRVVSVTDANGNATTYTYDGFGDLIQQVSPDSGKTVYSFDSDGNLLSKTDAAGNVTNNTYDTLDRILTTTYPANSTLDVSYAYDQGGHGFGVGRLTSLTDAAGTLSRSYDERANVLNETRVNGNTTLQTTYQYDPASRIASTTYPSGWTVSQTRDIMGRIYQLPVAAPGGASSGNAIANATYEPFGPLYTLSFGNGINEARRFDLDYRVTSLTDIGTNTLQSLTYSYDANDNVSSITDGVTPAYSQTLGYDALNRLTAASGVVGSLAYTYDPVGNRLTQTVSGAITTYGYTPATNRLASITAGGTMTPVSTTAAGGISGIPPTTGAPVAALNYSAANRLASVSGTTPAIAGILYDAFGKRLSKTDTGSYPILYTYDQNGNLLEEADGHGLLVDYIYLNGRPGAEITGGKLYYLHADRLGTPQLATDSSQNVVWSTTYQPFGTTPIPIGSITQNLRLPGQYADGETGFSYSQFRDYEPGLGRFLEDDPIGLAGGFNTYAYVTANPIKIVDRSGLAGDWNCAKLGDCSSPRLSTSPFTMSPLPSDLEEATSGAIELRAGIALLPTAETGVGAVVASFLIIEGYIGYSNGLNHLNNDINGASHDLYNKPSLANAAGSEIGQLAGIANVGELGDFIESLVGLANRQTRLDRFLSISDILRQIAGASSIGNRQQQCGTSK